MREYLQISALCVNNQMSYYTRMSRKQEKNNFTVITLRVELHDSGYTENNDFFFLNRDHNYLMILNKTK